MALSISGSVTAQQLAQAIVGSGITVSNVTYTGNPLQAGTFSGGLSAGGVDQDGKSGLGFDTGIVLSSGTAGYIAQAQTGQETTTAFGGPGDADLTAETGSQTYDAAVLEFDFNPGDATTIYFNFVFGTDEYPSSPEFNDGFAILVNGTNAATIPGDGSAAEISNFDKAANKAYYKVATVVAAQRGNEDGFPTQVINAEIQSMSVVLQGSASVLPNQTNHIKFAIADAGDDAVDSFFFIQGGSVSTVQGGSPAAPTIALSPASDSGVAGDGLTNVARPVVNGTGLAADTVTLFDGATQVGTGIVAANGTWSITSTTLADGTHSLTATVTDGSGNVSPASAILSVTIDTTAPAAPSAPVLTPASDSGIVGDGLTNINMPQVTGTGVAGDTIVLFDGAASVGFATVASDGTWSVTTSTLADGKHVFTATQSDPAANVSVASKSLTVTIETALPAAPSAPVLALASDSGKAGDGLTDINTPVVTGTGVATDLVVISDGTTPVGTSTVAANGSWSVTTTALAAGPHSFTATQSDAAGNVSAASKVLAVTIVDAPLPPSTPVLTPASDSGVAGDGITNVTKPTVTGTGQPGDTIKLLDGITPVGTATVASGGAWSVTTSALAAGSHSFTATQTDAGGDVSAASAPLTLTIQTALPAAPSAPVLAPASDSGIAGDGLTNVNTPVVTGTGIAGSAIKLLDGAASVGAATVAQDGTWSVTTSVLAEGAHSLTATQTDVAGNVSPASKAFALKIVTTVPAIPTIEEIAASTNPDKPVLDGVAAAGSAITLYDGSTTVGTAVTNAAGTWTYTFVSALSVGLHPLTASASDAAANVSPRSTVLRIQSDADSSYAVISLPDGSGDTTARFYNSSGKFTRIDTQDSSGALLQSVGATSAILYVRDSADVLIGTVVQPSTAATSQPTFTTSNGTLSALTASGATGSQVTLLSESNVVLSQGSDTISTGSGAATVFATGAKDTVFGGSGTFLLVGGTGSSTVFGGTGASTVFAGTAGGYVQGGSAGGNLLVAQGGITTLAGGGSGDTLAGSSGKTVMVMQANSTAFGGGGAATLFGGGNGVMVGGGGSTLLVADADTAETMFAGGGASTLIGGLGGDVMIGGAGKSLMMMKDSSTAFGGSGGSTIIGTGQGVMVGGGGTTLMVAEPGSHEAMFAGAGTVTVFGNNNATMVGGAGASTFYGDNGADMFFATGGGAMTIKEGNGANDVVFGAGAATVQGGAGADLYDVIAGAAGGAYAISGFKAGTDQIRLFGTDLTAVKSSIAGANTMLTLSDSTRITLLGVTHLAANSVV